MVGALSDLLAMAHERAEAAAAGAVRERRELLLKRAAEHAAASLEMPEVERQVVMHARELVTADRVVLTVRPSVGPEAAAVAAGRALPPATGRSAGDPRAGGARPARLRSALGGAGVRRAVRRRRRRRARPARPQLRRRHGERRGLRTRAADRACADARLRARRPARAARMGAGPSVRARGAPARRRRRVRRLGGAGARARPAGWRRVRQGGGDRRAERHDAVLHRGAQLGLRFPGRDAAPGEHAAPRAAAERQLRDRLLRPAHQLRAALRERRPRAPAAPHRGQRAGRGAGTRPAAGYRGRTPRTRSAPSP